MRIHQTWKNYVAVLLLQLDVPVVSARVQRSLVRLHTNYFVTYSERDGDARRPHLHAVFDAAFDVYRDALAAGYPEAEAREITHIQASWDFQNHGWGELVEFPPDEREDYYERYRTFYDQHGITPGEPFGDYAPDGLPDAPETPGRLDGPLPHAKPGLTDDVYVYAEEDEVRLRCARPEARSQ